ncbi:M48 family metallopeptidase [Opitutus sp. ER46]|uniref:M48 family metallopeptidase n=1 Tax=Opitutus sp. ER46 TaxID=2161864 RepID=UPI000D31C090|nr:M48 family metallopeptidase [Opitutus sp. ER46]PTX99048.1 M48 family peptidase [Opitutus sp. ER46]
MKRFTLVFVPLAVAVIAGCYTNPVTGRKSLVTATPEEEVKLGAQAFADVTKDEKVSTDPALNERVRRVGQRIARAVGNDLPGAQWEFTVFESDQVNAFALPGGKVGVYTGLLRLAATDDELATVIGHEIGHVTARHGAERMTEAQIAGGLGELGASALQTKIGDPKQLELYKAAYGGLVTVGYTLPHSRAQESEADRMGVVYAARAGYDPRAAITFWEKMVAQQKSSAGQSIVAKLLSSHPADEKRITDLQAMMPEMVPIYNEAKLRP